MKRDFGKINAKVSLVLIVITLCAALVGCGNDDTSKNVPQVSSAVVSENASPVSEIFDDSQDDTEIPGLTKPPVLESLEGTELELPDDVWE